jgi:hypothetical protein
MRKSIELPLSLTWTLPDSHAMMLALVAGTTRPLAQKL